MPSTRLTGHGLQHEGKPYTRNGEKDGPWVRCRGHIGFGLCECGATTPRAEWTDAARRRWHRDVHKPEVRARLEATDGT